MTTSGAGAWFPRFSDILDEAFEVGAGIDPALASQRHLTSARRSFNLLMIELENEGHVMQRQDQETHFVSALHPSFFVEPDTLSVAELYIRQKGVDRPLAERSFEEWMRIPTKAQLGVPQMWTWFAGQPRDLDQFIVDKAGQPIVPASSYGTTRYSQAQPTASYVDDKAYDPSTHGGQIILWPVPKADTEILYTRTRLTQEPQALGEHVDMRTIWMSAVTMGLASKLALKFQIDKFPLLEKLYNRQMELARRENRSRADMVIGGVGFDLRSRGGQRRRRRR